MHEMVVDCIFNSYYRTVFGDISINGYGGANNKNSHGAISLVLKKIILFKKKEVLLQGLYIFA